MNFWLNWYEVKNNIKGRDVIFFGRSEDWVRKSLKYVVPLYIVDSQSKFWGEVYEGLQITSLQKIKENNDLKPYFIITTGSYLSVIDELEKNNFFPGVDYCCCPEYKDYAVLDNLRNFSQKVIVTSPDYSSGKATRVSRAGGGIFEINIGTSQNEYYVDKKIDGQYRQIIKYKSNYVVVEHDSGELHLIDKSYKILEKFNINSPNSCGLAYCDIKDVFYMSNTHSDIITVLDSKFSAIDKFEFSNKSGNERNSFHHINDLTTHNGNLFVSYFSKSGNWRYNIYDGGAAIWNENERKFHEIISNLYMPHTPMVFDGKFHICDSSRGRLYVGTSEIKTEFSGFLRGLDYNGEYYILGLSETMYYSRLMGANKNIMLNAGIILYDSEKNISRIYPLLDLANIHQVMYI